MSKSDSQNNQGSLSNSEASLPRSIYVPQRDPRGNIRETVNSIFSDRFMIFLSLILIPIVLLPLIFTIEESMLVFFEICDVIIVILFVLEYALKLYLAENRWQHFKSPWHIIDLVIIVLPFIQYLSLLEVSLTGSPSLLLRLLRLPRALAVGGRAVAGRRTSENVVANQIEKDRETIIRQIDSNLKPANHNLTWEEFEAHLSEKNQQEWLDLHYVSNEGFLKLSSILHISEPHFKSSLMDEIYPHIDYVQRASFIFLQAGKVVYPENAEKFLTISRSGIIVICNGTKIITISRHSLDLFDKVIERIKQDKDEDAFSVPVLYGILEHMLDDYKAVLSELEIEALKIGSTPRSKLPKDFLERIYMLDKEVSRLVSNLVHFKDMLGVLNSKKVNLDGFNKKAEEAFQVLQDGAEYINELAHDLIDNIRSIIDLYINQTTFETNRILKILAFVTSISVIPSAIGGVIGMNLLDAPFGAYLWQVSFVISVSMILAVYVFYKLGWLKG